MEILTPGEKIRKIRKKYKITQKDLAYGVTTASMIGYYEKGKYKLKKDVATRICNKLMTIVHDTNFSISVTELLYSKEVQIKNYGDYLISNLNRIDEQILKNLKEIFNDTPFDSEKLRIYFAIACYYKNIKEQPEISLSLFEEILEIALLNSNNNFLCPIILNLQRIHNNADRFNDTKKLYFKTYEKIQNEESKIMGYITYNFALVFHKENQLKTAIKLYSKALKHLINVKIIEDCKNNLGVCYGLNSEYRKSNEYFIDLLNTELISFKKARCYSNLIINYIALKERMSVKICIAKLEEVMEELKNNNENRFQNYFCIGKAYLFLRDKYSAMKSFEKEIKLGIDTNSHHFFIEKYEYCIEKLIEIYDEHDLSKLRSLERYILNIPNELFNPKFYLKVLQKYIQAYTKEELLEFTVKMEKKLKDKR